VDSGPENVRDPLAPFWKEHDKQLIRRAVANPRDRQLVIDTLRELGWTITPPGAGDE
jgi:hypothetical protein